jgi:triosephosphate isomerase
MAGNWKMYKTPAETKAFFETLLPLVAQSTQAEIAICPPFVDIAAAVEAAAGSRVAVGGQNCEYRKEGAYTGEVSAPMLKAAGCSCVIIGHNAASITAKPMPRCC